VVKTYGDIFARCSAWLIAHEIAKRPNEVEIERWLREQGLSPWGQPAEEGQRGR
jgi:hypothetical protein